ncbi:MAG: DUF4489 domain-containing protein [Tepidibacter sp.]|jgi:hypothetical protein|uniref:DUF4489 domain-containing protein n=1 Tax=Tepidibacter sp. TaxID=2529387 RepID=UPI0025F7209F|nr:DUF4489 domain-containing protein [Tepidibacter sp.]MCT4508377.1 DUF4489 domain-containing protein [Tepidibacter sp.]
MSTYCNNYKKDNCDCYDKKYDGYDKKKHDYYDKKLDCDPCDYHDKKKGKNCNAILECGRTFDPSLPTTAFNALDTTTGDQPIRLAEVTVDARCLCVPCVKIEYSSIIESDPGDLTNADLFLTFRLVRKCKGEDSEEILRTWNFRRLSAVTSGNVELSTIDTFTVTHCECLDCCDKGKCCTYTLQLVRASNNNLASPSAPTSYNITEKDISAIAGYSACRQ